MDSTRLLALFQKRIEGDDALLSLARARFREAGLGAELYASSPEELRWLLGFRPSPELPVVVHLSREISILSDDSLALIAELSRSFPHEVYGFVLHDQREAAFDRERYLSAVHELERVMRGGQLLFIEYAVGLEPDLFLDIFWKIRELERVSACVDTGHVGLRQARKEYAERHHGEDLFSLDISAPAPGDLNSVLQEAVSSALPALLGLISGLGETRKPVHFHLHDGHPLHRGPYGVSDHLSFLGGITIPFGRQRMVLPLMYGASGLEEIVRTALRAIGPERLSLSLEIHPPGGREPLGEHERLFQHWRDRTNAERMNHWLTVLLRNHQLLCEALARP